MLVYFLSKIITIVFGMLYPAYCSFKAVKTKDVKEYVNWMMYWIVFAIYSVFEVFADTFLGIWFPFYYEIKILFLVWLLSPTTRGGGVLYRRFIHPFFSRHEGEIDGYLAEFKVRASNMIFDWTSRGFTYVTGLITTAIMRGGAADIPFIAKITRSYSYENFGRQDMNSNNYPRGGALQIEDSTSDFETSYVEELDPPPARSPRRRIASNPSSDVLLGRIGKMAKPYSMMDLSDNVDSSSSSSTRSRAGASSKSKKREDNMYGTLPRSKKVTSKSSNRR